jgi:tetratricopeptide (TPR) repeat protein
MSVRFGRPALLLTLALSFVGHAAESAHRFRPSSPDFVVLSHAAQRLSHVAPGNAREAASLARTYLDLARSTRDPRYFGRAEALLKPWSSETAVDPDLLTLQADIQQNRHDFAGARRLLDRAVDLDPRAPEPRLMRATLALVLGEPAQARGDCAALMGSGHTAVGAVCLAQVLAGAGHLEQAITAVELSLSRGELRDAGSRAWANATLADFFMRAANTAAAEAHLQQAVQATPQDESIRSSLADVLIARGAIDEALRITDIPRPSVGLLVRRHLALIAARDERRHEVLEKVQELLRLESERNEQVHLREETLLALGTGLPARETVRLALANFAVQREAIDARLLARAAVDARDEKALTELRTWVDRTKFRDALVQKLLRAEMDRT